MAIADLRRRHQAGESVQAVVVGLWRYSAGWNQYEAVTREESADRASVVFDVELCDVCAVIPREHVRCVVSSRLSGSVRKGALAPGSVVQITEWNLFWDDSTVQCQLYITICGVARDPVLCTCGVSDHSHLKHLASTVAPSLVGKKDLYYRAWSFQDPAGPSRHGPCDDFKASGRGECEALLTGMMSISSLAVGKSCDPICGRVVKKGHLTRYVAKKPSSQNWPFMFQVVLGDESGFIHVSFWHQMALACHDSINEADILLCRNFNVTLLPDTSHQKEIALVPCDDPLDVVTVLPERFLPADHIARLPAMDFNFLDIITLQQLQHDNVSVDEEFSVVGLVLHVSPWQRFRDKNSVDEFHQSRTLALRDETSRNVILMLVDATACSEKVFSSFIAGDLLVVTCCRVGHGHGSNTVSSQCSNDLMVVSMSTASQVHILRCHSNDGDTFKSQVSQSIFGDQPKVRDTADWLDRFDDLTAMCFATVDDSVDGSAHDRVVQVPLSLDTAIGSLQEVITRGEAFELVPAAKLMTCLDALEYRESKTVFLQATLAEIRFSCSVPVRGTAAAASAVDCNLRRKGPAQSIQQTKPKTTGPAQSIQRTKPKMTGPAQFNQQTKPKKTVPPEFSPPLTRARKKIQNHKSAQAQTAAKPASSSSSRKQQQLKRPKVPSPIFSPPLTRAKKKELCKVPKVQSSRLHSPRQKKQRQRPQRGLRSKRPYSEEVSLRATRYHCCNVGLSKRAKAQQTLEEGSMSSGISDESVVYDEKYHQPVDSIVPGSESEDTDADKRCIPHLSQVMRTGGQRKMSRGKPAAAGGGVPGTATARSCEVVVGHRQHKTSRTLQDLPDGIPHFQSCAGAAGGETNWTLTLQALNKDLLLTVPFRNRHAVVKHSQKIHSLNSLLKTTSVANVLCQGVAVDAQPDEAGLQAVEEFLNGIVAQLNRRSLLVMLNVHRSSASHVCTTLMGAFLMPHT